MKRTRIFAIIVPAAPAIPTSALRRVIFNLDDVFSFFFIFSAPHYNQDDHQVRIYHAQALLFPLVNWLKALCYQEQFYLNAVNMQREHKLH